MRIRACLYLAVLLGGLTQHVPAMAQIPVTDVAAIAQLIMQLQRQDQQLSITENHLTQARQTYGVLTGARGMERLLSQVRRNYLPRDGEELALVIQGISTAYPNLSANVRATLSANAILAAAEIAALDPGDRQELEAARRSAAALKALSSEQLHATSDRFGSLQSLIDALRGADDPKASMDLAARISAELTMVTNEANKLRVLDQSMDAERRLAELRRKERAIQGIGSLRSLPELGL
jgi:type IV secretion system protein VirB5